MNIQKLKTELAADSLGRGYAGMSDQEAADDLNTAYRQIQDERIDPATVYNNVDVSEFLALAAAQRQEVWDIIHVGGAGGLWIRSGDTARERFVAIFGGTSTTIANLLVVITHDVSRAVELGIRVKPGLVAEARKVP